MPTFLPSVEDVAQSIDHAILKPNLTFQTLQDELRKAHDLNVFSVCVRPADVSYAVNFFENLNSAVEVGTVIGFPHGSSTTATKTFEAVEAVKAGATEIDIVINISSAVDGQYHEVENEIRTITTAAREAGVDTVKVIFENAYLTDEQIGKLSRAMQHTGADFVKTSTGFAPTGAELEHVRIMKANCGLLEVKASGGIKNLDTYLAFADLGVTRFGTSNADVILEDLKARHTTGLATGRDGGDY